MHSTKSKSTQLQASFKQSNNGQKEKCIQVSSLEHLSEQLISKDQVLAQSEEKDPAKWKNSWTIWLIYKQKEMVLEHDIKE